MWKMTNDLTLKNQGNQTKQSCSTAFLLKCFHSQTEKKQSGDEQAVIWIWRRKRKLWYNWRTSSRLENHAPSWNWKVSASKKAKKNPHVETSFLPDREREEKEMQEREKLAKQWRDEQEKIKSKKVGNFPQSPRDEPIDITYSYWDGNGHRKTTTVGNEMNDWWHLADNQRSNNRAIFGESENWVQRAKRNNSRKSHVHQRRSHHPSGQFGSVAMLVTLWSTTAFMI